MWCRWTSLGACPICCGRSWAGKGRTHQIRIQFASRGLPLVGDGKYGGADCPMEGIALWSHRLEFDHPQTGERMRFSAPPPEGAPWSRFAGWGNVDGNRG